MTARGAFAAAEPELAAFVAERVRVAPSYLATVRANDAPRDGAVQATVVAASTYRPADSAEPGEIAGDRDGWPAQLMDAR